jgi:hypothetical protein
MKLIGLEEHILPADFVEQVLPTPLACDGLTAKLIDIEEHRLLAMDEAGIDMQVLSVTAPGSQHVPTETAAELSRGLSADVRRRSRHIPIGSTRRCGGPFTASGRGPDQPSRPGQDRLPQRAAVVSPLTSER